MIDNSKKYWCVECCEYCMDLVNEDSSDDKVFLTLECPICFNIETEFIYLDEC